MVVMLSLMRLLEARGSVLDWWSPPGAAAAPAQAHRAGSVFAALQISLVSFAAPVVTAHHDGRARRVRPPPRRHAGMGDGDGAGQRDFPDGLDGTSPSGRRWCCRCSADWQPAMVTLKGFGRGLSAAEAPLDETLHHRASPTT